MDWSALLSSTQEAVSLFVSILLTSFCVLLGLIFIFSALNKMAAYARGERQGQSTAGPVGINLLIGSIMLQLGRFVDLGIETVFGSARQEPSAVMSYLPAPVQGNELLRTALEVGVWWVFAIGFVAVIHGMVLWNAMANGNSARHDNSWRGLWHVFFGFLAINMPGVLQLFN